MSAPAAELPAELARVHMVGIGGAGMSGLARLLIARGARVSGSDAKESRGVTALRMLGARIAIGHSREALDMLDGGPTVVVTTHAAIPKDNPELLEAADRGIEVLLRPRVLARLMAGARGVMVTGTHGKTSTTSMIVAALTDAGLDPSFAVGGELNESGTNAHQGAGDVFVAEGDESDGSILEFAPDVAVVTNVEADHLDFFGTTEDYVAVFDAFAGRIPDGGALVVCLDDPGAAAFAGRVAPVLAARDVAVYGYGEGLHAASAPTVPLTVRLVSYAARGEGGTAELAVTDVDGRAQTHGLHVGVPGRHMALNAVAALIACVCVGATAERALAGLSAYTGVNRRFTPRGTAAGVAVYDDYAHHPTEVRAVLTAARELAGERGGRVIAIFQPHLYSRTRDFAADFAVALGLADVAYVVDVYGARERPIPGVTGESIADAVPGDGRYAALPDLPDAVAAEARPGDVVLTLGAGDITMQGPVLLAALRAHESSGGRG